MPKPTRERYGSNLDGTYSWRMLPGMTNNAIPLQVILYGQNDQFYHAVIKNNLDEFHIRNAYKMWHFTDKCTLATTL